MSQSFFSGDNSGGTIEGFSKNSTVLVFGTKSAFSKAESNF
jgi:hypothetical protein